MKYVALIGCGFIGASLAKFIDQEANEQFKLEVLYDEKRSYAEALSQTLASRPKVADSAEAIFSDSNVQLVVEAASQEAAKIYLPEALSAGKDVLVMSVGVLSDKVFYEKIRLLTEQKNTRVFIPSGAIAGLDWIKAAAQVGLDRVSITIRKPPLSLGGSPFVVKNGIDLASIREPTQIFEGSAIVAASEFPANVNVATALSICGIGAERTHVRVIADPTVSTNIHEILAEGAAGKVTIKVENVPSPKNPKTSWVAALSANQKLREMVNAVSVGT